MERIERTHAFDAIRAGRARHDTETHSYRQKLVPQINYDKKQMFVCDGGADEDDNDDDHDMRMRGLVEAQCSGKCANARNTRVRVCVYGLRLMCTNTSPLLCWRPKCVCVCMWFVFL